MGTANSSAAYRAGHTQHTHKVIHTCIATHESILSHSHSCLIWLRRLKDEYKHTSTLEKTVHVKIIPVP